MGRAIELGAIINDFEGDTFSVKKQLSKLDGWTEDEIRAALTDLEETGAVSPFGRTRATYMINADKLEEFLASAKSKKKTEKTKLVNKLPAAPLKKSALDAVLARIDKIPRAAVYEGEALEAKLNEVVESLINLVGRVNEGIIALSERAPDIVDSSTDLISLRRVMPEKAGGAGGVIAEYSGDGGYSKKVLFQRAWAKAPTDAWFRHLEKDLECECTHMLGRMAKYVEKHNKQR